MRRTPIHNVTADSAKENGTHLEIFLTISQARALRVRSGRCAAGSAGVDPPTRGAARFHFGNFITTLFNSCATFLARSYTRAVPPGISPRNSII